MLPDNIALSVIDVINLRQKKERAFVRARSFSAMTLRLNTPGKYISNNKVYEFEPVSICIIPEGISYERNNNEDNILVIHFNILNYAMEEIQIFKVTDAEKYKKLFFKAFELKYENKVGCMYKITAITYEILSELASDIGLNNNLKDSRITESAEYIRQNFWKCELSIEEVAKKACVTPAYFRREFRRIYNCAPKEYLDTLRIQYAKTLLETGYFSQKEISFRCGFSDVAYFRTAFKRKIGKSIKSYLSDQSRYDH